jgi:hypothetical protein
LTELEAHISNKGLMEKDHLVVGHDMMNEIIGVGDLLAQKIIFADATLGLKLPISVFNNCTPSSSQHIKVLKKTPFNFKHMDQVQQLVTSITVQGRMARENPRREFV